MVALAVRSEAASNSRPPAMSVDRVVERGMRLPVMRAFPRLAVDRAESVAIDFGRDEEPERWDGMA